ncbi:10310_t:CDS:2 [Paraglomus occultum]|uniref:10310_t:CDS:1 n=1 Tax=Paraglomus occultum TaxID=144539 RepID=A0A9N8VPC5_9GLOM|nr:10310_t:CDS:2 [Paraglomus occultum]
MSSEPSSTPSGIITTETNERLIPSSRRADGSVRRERRVRAGYVPQEDVQIYQNRHVRKQENLGAITENLEALNLREGNDGQQSGETLTNKPQTEIEIARKIRTLEKKLIQIDKLKEKADLGETLLPEQQEKVDKSDSLREELDALKKLLNK